jgi:hypothetical protein
VTRAGGRLPTALIGDPVPAHFKMNLKDLLDALINQSTRQSLRPEPDRSPGGSIQ